MKVFISWSGAKSKEAAKVLKKFLKAVIQETKPWYSEEDIEQGSIWFNSIAKQLEESKIGIIVLTKENLHKPWILFEAGCIYKGTDSNRTCTFLVDLNPADLTNPLATFNATKAERGSLKKLILEINKHCSNPLDNETLENSFEAHWPRFEEAFKEIQNKDYGIIEKEEKSERDLIEEILELTRGMNRRMIHGSTLDKWEFVLDFYKDFYNLKSRKDNKVYTLIKENLKDGLSPVNLYEAEWRSNQTGEEKETEEDNGKGCLEIE